MFLVAPVLPQKEWYAKLHSLLVDPIELLMPWNLLVQLHVRTFHRGLESLRLHSLKLSSDPFEWQAL